MGQMVNPKCRACGHEWAGELLGGTMLMGVYRCTKCPETREVTIVELSAAGLDDAPWSLPARKADHVLGRCACGGRFRYDAPVRCPECHSDDVDVEGDSGVILVD